MDVNEYISSGILELYASGALSPEEMKHVEEMAASHSEIAAELKAVQEALDRYALSDVRNPNPSVRASIMKEIVSPAEKIARSNVRVHRTYKGLIIACIVSLFLSTIASVFFFQKWSEEEDHYLLTRNNRDSLLRKFIVIQNEFDKNFADMLVMHDENVNAITLNATDSTKKYKARVYWNKYNRMTYIDVLDLPAPDSTHEYQLWATFQEQYVDAGTFSVPDEMRLIRLKNIVNADEWTVTLEPKGGTFTPDSSQVYLRSFIPPLVISKLKPKH